jgi:phosphatidylserine/phosphatidylglycerophosphate/cardiolipin synthase-like enzyme
MTWLLLATGFTGALTLAFVLRSLARYFGLHLVIAAHFSPKAGCTDAVVREIKSARREILIQAYSFTSKPIAQALIEAKARGVHVDILLDKSNEQETYTELGHLLQEGLAPHIDAQHAIAHNKIMIIDRRTLITGSFNFTHQAESENAENLLIIKGHPELVQTYFQQFATHKAHCQPPKPQANPTPHRAAA